MRQQMTKVGVLLGLLLSAITVVAQGATVPDLTGMNVPQAVAQLNRAGLRLGEVAIQPLSGPPVLPPGSVAGQSILHGEVVEPGAAVDVTVLGGAKLTLIYDDNDLTLRNDADETIPLNDISFSASNGAQGFSARRWRSNLPVGDCTQVWTIGRGQPKPVDGCGSIFWLVTNETAEHFWTQTAGVESFSVIQNGSAVATCNAAPAGSQDRPTTCEFYLASGSISAETTDFVYFAYTADRFAVINVSDDRWMPLDETTIYNFNPAIQVAGASLELSDNNLWPDASPVASTQRLAPGQCLMLTLEPLTDAPPPAPCDVIAQRPLVAQVIFWSAPFELDVPSGERSQCPAAVADRLTLCLMPR